MYVVTISRIRNFGELHPDCQAGLFHWFKANPKSRGSRRFGVWLLRSAQFPQRPFQPSPLSACLIRCARWWNARVGERSPWVSAQFRRRPSQRHLLRHHTTASSWPIILNTVELGMPSSLAILRPVLPCERSRATSSRCAFTVDGRPNLIPFAFAAAKPALIRSTATERLNSEIASSVSRNALPDTLEVSMPDLE